MKEKVISALKWFFKSFIWLFIVLLALDIVTKQIILHCTPDESGLIADWKIVKISYVLNENAAFGIGVGNPTASRIIYLIIATLASAGIITYLILKRKTTKLFVRAALMMVVAGAIGNMIDRVFYGTMEYENVDFLFTGSVVDWIHFDWVWDYVFNIADCCIVIAAFMLIIYIIVGEVKDAIAKKRQEEPAGRVLSVTEKERLEEQEKKKD